MEFTIKEGDYAWSARTRFASWAGYRDCSGPYGSQDSDEAADGSIDVVFAPEGRDDQPLTAEELSLVQWLVDHEPSVSEAVKDAVHAEYLRLRESDEYGYSYEERDEYMPAIGSRDGLKPLIGLHSINVHQIAKGRIPYLGFELGCSWDDEHGMGVLMHGTRVVKVGGADTAILLWMAEEDAKRA